MQTENRTKKLKTDIKIKLTLDQLRGSKVKTEIYDKDNNNDKTENQKMPKEQQAKPSVNQSINQSINQSSKANLSLCCHSKQSLFASNNLYRSDSTECLARLRELNFATFNAAQLTTVIMTPAIDSSTSAPTYRPIRGAPANEAKHNMNHSKWFNERCTRAQRVKDLLCKTL